MRAGAGERAEMRGAAHHHHVEHGVGEMGGVRLRDVSHTARDRAAAELLERLAVEPDAAALGREQAEQGLEQGGLAAAVGAEQADHLPGLEEEVGIAADRLAGIAEGEVARLEAHAQPCRPRASSQRNTGAPTNAVRMPIGVSTAARVRASVSTSNR